MISLFTAKSGNAIASRCREDESTQLRLRYKPFYRTFERQVGAHVWLDGREMIMLSSNDYLGLTHHPKVIESAQRGVAEWGTSPTGARLSNGSRSYHLNLEEKLAAFIGKEACHISAAGYLSCMSAIQSFAQKGDVVLGDKNLHSSIWAGLGLTQAKAERFAHNSPASLRELLSYESLETPKIVAFEGVYSMEGHIAAIPEILAATHGQNCFLVMDDAHGFGVLGQDGRGTANHFGATESIDLIAGSFSKALASTGGFVAGSRDVIEYLRSHSKQTIFSAALAPAQSYAAEAALDLLAAEPEHLRRLWENTRRYKQILAELKLDTWNSETPAVPIVLGTKERAYRFWQHLMDRGVFTVMSIAPAVPPGKDLVRTAISACHTEEDLSKIADAMAFAARRL
jgi:7-keto-8-aminopelargonate synthetase-like enzyme